MRKLYWMPEKAIGAIEALEEQRRYITRLISLESGKIDTAAHELLANSVHSGKALSFDVTWGHSCPEPSNPIKICCYDLEVDFGEDWCVFCGDPSEQK